MKGHAFNVCVLVCVIAICGACYGKPTPKASKAKPTASSIIPAALKADAPTMALPSSGPNIPTAPSAPSAPVGPVVPNVPESPAAPTPSAGGAGPSAPDVSMASAPGTAVAVDSTNVYVFQSGKLYKFAKSDVSACGTAIPSAQICMPCGTGAGPAASTLVQIPGGPTTCTVTTYTPRCPPTGAGPSNCDPCPAIVKCASCEPCAIPESATCDPCSPVGSCGPQYTETTTTMACPTTACGAGCGPAACPSIAGISAATQSTIACLQQLCGADVDRAYLQAVIQLNLAILSLSDASADHLGSTSLQNYATNSISDSRGAIDQAQDWLRTKYCMDVAACAPKLGGLNICDIDRPGKEFDDAYRNQLVQYYVDEIALSRVETERGLDCEVKAFAAKMIKDDMVRIKRLKRCNICSW